MRTILFFLACFTGYCAAAQTIQAAAESRLGKQYQLPAAAKDSAVTPKWFFSRYAGISTEISVFNGGHATFFSMPVGLRLNRKISNNWYVFAGLSAAPSFMRYSGAQNFFYGKNFSTAAINTPFTNLATMAEMGLMYTNDKKTFSISGSVGIERNSYPWMPGSFNGQSGYILPQPSFQKR